MGAGGAFDQIDRYVRSLRAAVTIPGLALAVTSRDGLVGVRTYGLAEIASRRPVEPDTLFQIGSIGKSFTACCVLQLVEEGRLDLHAPVTGYLPWFEVRSAFDEPIAPHHLLTHTAGITRGADITSNSLFDVFALRETEATAPPGAFFWYSNVGYRVIGAVIEAVEGRSYPDVLRDRVLVPLGMDRSEPAITNAIRPRLAQGYGPWPDDRPVLPTDPLTPAVWFETGTADGSVAATAQDMATYLRMFMNRGAGDRQRILSEEGFELMTGRTVVAGEDEWYGYGLGLAVRGGIEYLGHGGDMVGFVSSMDADLAVGVGAVVLINGRDWGDLTGQVARYAIRAVAAEAGGDAIPPPPERPDPARVDDAESVAGRYTSPGGRELTIRAEGDRPVMVLDDRVVPLAQRAPGVLVARDPAFDRFALTFERDAEGRVVAACHGATRYARDGSEPFPGPEPDPAWTGFVGHYESSNPWTPHFRVIERAGTLWFCEQLGTEIPLAPIGDGLFGVADERVPERLRFDAIVDGKALRANLSGCDYFRSFSP